MFVEIYGVLALLTLLGTMQVKTVRESMNRMIEAWREIPDLDEEVCSFDVPPSSQSTSSLTGDVSLFKVYDWFGLHTVSTLKISTT
jgi:hypothetical protein